MSTQVSAKRTGIFVDGKNVPSVAGEWFDVTDPSNQDVIGQVARGRAADIDLAVKSALAAFPIWRDETPAVRGRVLNRIALTIRERSAELAELEARDTGKTLTQTAADLEGTARYFEYYAAAADLFQGETIPLGPRYLAYTINEPFGVVGVIVPWNSPINQAARSLGPALAAGNTVVLKPAEDAPLTCLELARLVIDCGLPAGALNVVPGMGEEAGQPLVEHVNVRKVSFTGSVEVGRHLARIAGDRLIPVSLELGGKSANIVFDDADLDVAAANATIAITGHNGQACSAGSRLLVQQGIYDDLVERVSKRMGAMRLGPGIDNPDLGPLANAAQFDRVSGYLTLGVSEGARLVTGGRPSVEERLAGGFFVEPTLFADVTPNMRIAQEEIFGPVLVAMPFKDEEEAIRIANGTPYGLVAGVFTRDLARAHRVARRLEAGQVFVNEWWAGGVETPFGGYKDSGLGREKGFEAMRHYSQLKTVIAHVSRAPDPATPG